MVSKKTATEETTDIEIAVPEVAVVRVGSETFEIGKFKLGKSLRVMELLSKMIEDVDAPSVLARFPGMTEQQMIAELLGLLPRFISSSLGSLMRTLAIICIPDARFKQLRDEGGIEAEIERVQELIEDEGDFESFCEILGAGIDGIGLEALRKNGPSLLKRFSATR